MPKLALTMTVNDVKSTISPKFLVYKEDYGIDVEMTIKGIKYEFRPTDSITATVQIVKQNLSDSTYLPFSKMENGVINFTITDELHNLDVGVYFLQVVLIIMSLADEDRGTMSQITLAPAEIVVMERL